MNPAALKLLNKEQICVLAVTLGDGSPHAAVVHYSQETDPVKLFIQTYPTIKAQAIKDHGGSTQAAVVVGLNEPDFVTLQMRGNVRIVTDEKELEHVFEVHYAKHPNAEKYKSPTTIILEFVPTWWRYTDFNTEPETITEG